MRRQTALLGAIAVVAVLGITAIRLLAEPECPSGGDSPVSVLVAKQLIEKGTTGDAVVSRSLYAPMVIRCSERQPGAIADPEALLGREAVLDVFPGQSLTEADFEHR